jgi:hypothetical protein
MRDLRIAGGDLIMTGGTLGLVDGTAYIRQRIATALAEPYGSDPFQPAWGSTLNSGWAARSRRAPTPWWPARCPGCWPS